MNLKQCDARLRQASTPSESLQELLLKATWMQPLPTEIKERVLADAYEAVANAGSIVAHRGVLAQSWIGVAEGLLKISSVNRSGRVVMLTRIPEGSWVGEGSVIKGELRRYDIVAMRRTRVIHIPGVTLRWMLATCIEFNGIIIARLNQRLAQYISMVEIDRVTDPVARVARAIATLFDPVLYPQMTSLVPLSQTELGELIGLSRQSVSAALRRLQTERLLSMGYGGVAVLDLPALAGYAESDQAPRRQGS